MTSSGWRTATAASDGCDIHRVYLGVGTNLGERRVNLARALDELARVGTIEAVSSVYESEPVGFAEQPRFWNLALRLGTTLPPLELLNELKGVEHRLGRRPTFRHGPRIIDLDVLLYDDLRVATPELEIPHPRMMDRAFVLRPLLDLEPELRHPESRERLSDRMEHGGLERVVPLFPGSDLLPT